MRAGLGSPPVTDPGGNGQGRGRRQRPPTNRIVLWIVGVAVGGYLVISGVVGILSHR
jgi:hypothetical protein